MIKVIAFDYADVIAPSPFAKWMRANLKPTDKSYQYYKKHTQQWDRGEANRQKLYEVVYRVTGVPAHKVWKVFYENYIADKNLVELIKNLKRNYKIILFSNFVGEILRELLEKDNITKLFDEIIISSEYKMQKPNTDFFNVLIGKSGVKRNEILFIDDKLKNVEGAKKSGINSIVYESFEKLKKDLEEFGIKIAIDKKS